MPIKIYSIKISFKLQKKEHKAKEAKVKAVDEIEEIFGKDHKTYDTMPKSPPITQGTPNPTPDGSLDGSESPVSPTIQDFCDEEKRLEISEETEKIDLQKGTIKSKKVT
jgi:hypothetical protein